MKIISVDNFNRETVSDILVCENIEAKQYGDCMVKALNDKFSGEDASRYYRLVPNDHKLYKFEP